MITKKITLAVEHQHNGIIYAKGDEIKVDETNAAWLIENDIGIETVHKQDVLVAPSDANQSSKTSGRKGN